MARVDVQAALWGQVRDAPNFSRLTIEACAVQVQAAIQSLSVALDHARAFNAESAAHYAEDALRLLEGAPSAYQVMKAREDEVFILHERSRR